MIKVVDKASYTGKLPNLLLLKFSWHDGFFESA